MIADSVVCLGLQGPARFPARRQPLDYHQRDQGCRSREHRRQGFRISALSDLYRRIQTHFLNFECHEENMACIDAWMLSGCSDFLDPLPNGHYTDQNLDEYPSTIRGFVDKTRSAAHLLYEGRVPYLDGATDDWSSPPDPRNAAICTRSGDASKRSFPPTYWARDYQGIMYVNRFLENDLGLNTLYDQRRTEPASAA